MCILTCSVSNNLVSGVLVCDISDHFFTFICPQSNSPKQSIHKTTISRDFSLPKLNNFKQELGLVDWNPVYQSNDVESAYDCFWSIYSNLYKINFPPKRIRFNKNFNGKFKFMTNGLLISRRTKNNLHALAVSDPSAGNVNRYKAYKSVYLRTIRAAKKLYISSKITENAKSPKKTWQTLNEILGKQTRPTRSLKLTLMALYPMNLSLLQIISMIFLLVLVKRYQILCHPLIRSRRNILNMEGQSPPFS